MFVPRQWQKDCVERCKSHFDKGEKSFVIEASMGAGKSAVAAWIAKVLLEEYDIGHVLVLVPWKSIQGESDKGMLGAFGKLFGLDARDRFFTGKRQQAYQPVPATDATVTLYHEVCNSSAVETLTMWKEKGLRFAIICDEIHHTNEINGTWGVFVERMVNLAEYAVFMSGTYFRGDRNPIKCIQLDPDNRPIKDYAYTYPLAVRDRVVRPVTARYVNAQVTIFDPRHDVTYEKPLSEAGYKELAAAKKQILDPNGECMRRLIELVHEGLMRTRQTFSDAACLYVCRPGKGDDYTPEGSEAVEDKHVFILAKQIEELTGIVPTVVTHRDKDAQGKISRFRRGFDPYLVAVNMVSEGCDIPRLRAVAFCRYTTSEMLFRQIVGRALRMHDREDGTAAQIYVPKFPNLVKFAEQLWSEAQEGIKDRRCKTCGGIPCECPCEKCGQYPCICPPEADNTSDPLQSIDVVPLLDGGRMGSDDVHEDYVSAATTIATQKLEHIHANVVQLGHALQYFDRQIRALKEHAIGTNPVAERERIGRKINRQVRRLAILKYHKKFQDAFYHEINVPFKESLQVILNTWSIDRLRDVEDRIEARLTEELRRA